MTDTTTRLMALSGDFATLAAAAGPLVATVTAGVRVSAMLWQAEILVTSEQCLPKAEEYQVVLPGGVPSVARLIGRDPGTNLAALRVAGLAAPPSPGIGEPRIGGLALALGGDGEGGATVRLAMLHQVGPAWHSQAGGRIDRRILLDTTLAPAEEGGPVVDAAGQLLGMSALGPRGRALVIPAATIARVIAALLADGRVARGWLGVALQPVAVPEDLWAASGCQAGLMVMGMTANSPAVAAGMMQGDVMLSIDGQPALRPRAIAERFGPDSIGSKIDVRLLRAGQVLGVTATVTARPQ